MEVPPVQCISAEDGPCFVAGMKGWTLLLAKGPTLSFPAGRMSPECIFGITGSGFWINVSKGPFIVSPCGILTHGIMLVHFSSAWACLHPDWWTGNTIPEEMPSCLLTYRRKIKRIKRAFYKRKMKKATVCKAVSGIYWQQCSSEEIGRLLFWREGQECGTSMKKTAKDIFFLLFSLVRTLREIFCNGNNLGKKWRISNFKLAQCRDLEIVLNWGPVLPARHWF